MSFATLPPYLQIKHGVLKIDIQPLAKEQTVPDLIRQKETHLRLKTGICLCELSSGSLFYRQKKPRFKRGSLQLVLGLSIKFYKAPCREMCFTR